MLSDQSFYRLLRLAQMRARQPHLRITGFCLCSISANPGACSRRRPRHRARRSHRRRARLMRGKSSDPGDGSRPDIVSLRRAQP